MLVISQQSLNETVPTANLCMLKLSSKGIILHQRAQPTGYILTGG